jgi:hypothetical protein
MNDKYSQHMRKGTMAHKGIYGLLVRARNGFANSFIEVRQIKGEPVCAIF